MKMTFHPFILWGGSTTFQCKEEYKIILRNPDLIARIYKGGNIQISGKQEETELLQN